MKSEYMSASKKIKESIIPVLLLTSLLICGYKATEIKKKEKTCLILSGQVVATGDNASKVHVKLIEENKAIDSLIVDPNVTFKFNLKGRHYYAVRITQEGTVPRLISISTWMPEGLREVNLYKFHFDLYQLRDEQLTAETTDILDFPIALIKYDEVKGYFDYNSFYTTHIKNTYNKLKRSSDNIITTSL